jgi:hypothetical protein
MSTHLHHLVAQQKITDLVHAAEQARLTQGSRTIEPASRRDGLLRRFLTPALRRLPQAAERS